MPTIDQTADATLRACVTTGKLPKAKIWTSDAEGTVTRIYTGERGEYIEVVAPGRVALSRKSMTWGHLLRPALTAEGIEY